MKKKTTAAPGAPSPSPLHPEAAKAAATAIRRELETYINPEKRLILSRFFKTGKGEYGEGDKFLGVVVPDTRRVARGHRDAPFAVAAELLQSEWHECRLCALLMLVERFAKSSGEERQRIYEFYLSQTARINNWDLVDLSAPAIVGGFLMDKPRTDLYTLAASPLLWDRRIAVVSTLTFIRNHDFIDTIRLAEYFVGRKPQPDGTETAVCLRNGRPVLHDLMQKAIGWMLREMGKRDRDLLVQFLEKHAATLPRTTLRYAIEKFDAEERAEWMKR